MDPFEANNLRVVAQINGTIGGSGFSDVNVTLTRLNSTSGYNHFLAVLNSPTTGTGAVSNKIILRLN